MAMFADSRTAPCRRQGAPRGQADVAVTDGRIAEIGKIGEKCNASYSTRRCVVAPALSTRTLITRADLLGPGDLALLVAWRHLGRDGQLRRRHRPCRPEAREIATRTSSIPRNPVPRCSNAAISWDWQTFPQFLDAAE